LKTDKLTGRTFEVTQIPTPEAERGSSSGPTQSDRGRWWQIPACVATAVIGWLVARRALPWWKRVRAERAGSESAYFARFRRASRCADPHAVYVAFLEWLDHFGPISLDEFTSRVDDPELTKELDGLKARLYSRSAVSEPWSSARALFVRAKLARNSLRRVGPRTGPDNAIPPLNPIR
jgi:hypothetical protein